MTHHFHIRQNFIHNAAFGTITITLAFAFLAGCTDATRHPQSEGSTSFSSSTSTHTAVFSPTTQEPSSTATITPTGSPTPVAFPVGNSTLIPDVDYEPITTENVSRIQPIARYGSATFLNAKVDQQNRHVFLATTGGISILDSNTMEKIGFVNVRIPHGINTHTYFPEEGNPDISENGKYILVINGDLDLELWSIDGAQVWTKPMAWKEGSQETPRKHISADISPDAKFLAQSYCSQDGPCRILVTDASTDNRIADLEGYYPEFSTTGKYLVYFRKAAITVYDFDTQKIIHNLPIPAGQFDHYSLVNVGADDRLAVVESERINIWDLDTLEVISTYTSFKGDYYGSPDNPPTVAFSPDGSYMIVGEHIYEEDDPLEIFTYKIADHKVTHTEEFLLDHVYWVSNDGELHKQKIEGRSISSIEGTNLPLDPIQIDINRNQPAVYGLNREYFLDKGEVEGNISNIYSCIANVCTETEPKDERGYAYTYDQGRLIEVFGNPEKKQISISIDGQIVGSLNVYFYYLRIRRVFDNLLLFEAMHKYSQEGAEANYLVDLDTGKVLDTFLFNDDLYPSGYSNHLFAGKIALADKNDWQYNVRGYDTGTLQYVYKDQDSDHDIFQPLEQTNSMIMVDFYDGIHISQVDIQTKIEKTNTVIRLPINSIAVGERNKILIAITNDESLFALSNYDGTVYIYDTRANEVIYHWPAHMYSLSTMTFSEDRLFLATYSLDGFMTIWGIPKSR